MRWHKSEFGGKLLFLLGTLKFPCWSILDLCADQQTEYLIPSAIF
jgi:hypothetical protein